MTFKNSITDYTESEFLALVRAIFSQNDNPSEATLDSLIAHYVAIVERPNRADLIYHCTEENYTPEIVTRIIKDWYAENGKSCFKPG